MHEVERQHNELRASARTLVRGLIGRTVNGKVIKDIGDASIFVNLAYWRAVVDRWNTPNSRLSRDYSTVMTPGMVYYSHDRPPSYTEIGQREFGARCLVHKNSERAGPEPEKAAYLFSASYMPFYAQQYYSGVSMPAGHCCLLESGKL